LLGKFPDEELKPGDEYFDRTTTKWRCSANANLGTPQSEDIWYRRRIEEVEPEPKHYVLPVGYTATLPNGQTITATEKGFEVTE
jgi:hypothetical protein